jgi:hypothetical protein
LKRTPPLTQGALESLFVVELVGIRLLKLFRMMGMTPISITKSGK